MKQDFQEVLKTIIRFNHGKDDLNVASLIVDHLG